MELFIIEENAVFIGKDESGTPKYAACRGIISSFKRDASGSDKRYSFRLLTGSPCASVHLFEAAMMYSAAVAEPLTKRNGLPRSRSSGKKPMS